MKKIAFLATACFLMTSCVIDKREMVSVEDQYNKEFANVFGETDPNHTWKMVDNRLIEVNLDKPSRVKIYVKVGKNYKLVADYENVTGKQQLPFDAPMGCEDVYVTVNGVPYQSAGSRTSVIPTDNDVISVGSDSDYEVYTYGELDDFFDDTVVLPERENNITKVTLDYRAIADDNTTYTFYPLFWNAYFSHTFGLYYYDTGGYHEFDFYMDKEGDELQYYDGTDEKWKNVTNNYVFSYIKNMGFAPSDEVLRCRPYTIDFPSGTTEFGFYVKVYEPGKETPRATYYSNPALNEANSISSFAYLEVDGNTYITIEDHNHDDFDYNDFIFVMEGTQKHITEDPTEYIYAVEDLGGTDDFDFNDVVFSVSHVSGQPHATVKPLAAGGTLQAYICFNSSYTSTEVHQMFDVDTKVMVNTADGTTKANMMQASPFVVQVGGNWSHTDSDKTFKVMVKKNGNNTIVTTPMPGQHAAPQILVLAEDWLWPTERTRINAAYPQFGEWGGNYTNSTWVDNRVYENVVDWIGTQN